jgi:hypothetical protein
MTTTSPRYHHCGTITTSDTQKLRLKTTNNAQLPPTTARHTPLTTNNAQKTPTTAVWVLEFFFLFFSAYELMFLFYFRF